MVSTVQAGVATVGIGPQSVPMTGEPLQVYQHVQFVNLSAVAGWGSIDAGASWVYIPAGIGASNTIDTSVIRSLRCVIQRLSGGTDITVFVAAF